jgi:cytochrome o ubiquinol oxidase subunit IV
MSGRHEAPTDIGSAPGAEQPGFGQVLNYLIGLVLSAILTAAAFYFVRSSWLWQPSIPVALSVLAVSQIGVHLVFFLHLTTGRDNVNNILALAFGTLIVTLVIGGTLWISYNLDNNMPMSEHATEGGDALTVVHDATREIMNASVRIEARSRISGKVASISCDIGMSVKKGQTCAIIDAPDLSVGLEIAEKGLLSKQARVRRDKQIVAKFRSTDTSQKAVAARAKVVSDQGELDSIAKSMEDARQKLEESRIIAPIDGVVISRDLHIGQDVGPESSDPLFVFGKQM